MRRDDMTPMAPLTPRDAASGPATAPRPPAAPPRSDGVASMHEGERQTTWATLSIAAASSRGGMHRVNEDSHSALDRDAALYVVADGVGGGAEAARASRELVSRLHASLDDAPHDPATLRAALLAADRAIGKSIATRGRATGAATVALCMGAGRALSRWLVAWVGDCRVYRLRAGGGGTAHLLTVDDTYRHLDESPPPGGSPDDPARMVGNGAVVRPNVLSVDLRDGDMLVLVSDGVHKHATPDEIARLLREPGPLARRCQRLIERARHGGSRDDATVLVVARSRRGVARVAAVVAAAAAIALVVGALSVASAGPPAQDIRHAVPPSWGSR